MAQHDTIESMQKEALQEMLEVAEYCIDFDKSKDDRWKNYIGCYGYPGAIMLLSIVDSLGCIIEGGGDDVGKHFEILNNKNWYNFSFSPQELELIEKAYRNKLFHNAHIRSDVILDIGKSTSKILELNESGKYILNLRPFLDKSIIIVNKFIKEEKIKTQ